MSAPTAALCRLVRFLSRTARATPHLRTIPFARGTSCAVSAGIFAQRGNTHRLALVWLHKHGRLLALRLARATNITHARQLFSEALRLAARSPPPANAHYHFKHLTRSAEGRRRPLLCTLSFHPVFLNSPSLNTYFGAFPLPFSELLTALYFLPFVSPSGSGPGQRTRGRIIHTTFPHCCLCTPLLPPRAFPHPTLPPTYTHTVCLACHTTHLHHYYYYYTLHATCLPTLPTSPPFAPPPPPLHTTSLLPGTWDMAQCEPCAFLFLVDPSLYLLLRTCLHTFVGLDLG